MFDVDWMGLLSAEVLRERRAALIAEACAWAVGVSDQPHYRRRAGRLVATGLTIGERAATGQPLGDDSDGRLELGDARPGSFQDALNALEGDGTLVADRFDEQVLHPFAHEVCLTAAERARRTRRRAWEELADDVGEDEGDAAGVVRAGGWEEPVRTDAEHLVLAALADVPLIEVEAEGLPLSLVRAAESVLRNAAPRTESRGADEEPALAGAVFLAEAAMGAAALPVPVAVEHAGRLLAELLEAGLDAEEIPGVLPHLAVRGETADAVVALLRARGTFTEPG